MAMNKKEKAAVRALEIRCALRFSRPRDWPVEPDVAIPEFFDGYVEGWSFNVHRSIGSAVYRSWSSGSYHGSGHRGARPEHGGSQKPTEQYSSEALALKALRAAMELQFAEKLHEVDLRIAKAEAVNGL